MTFIQGRTTRAIIASCVVLLFFLLVAFPTRYFFLNDDFIHIPLAAEGSLLTRSFIRPVADISLFIDHFFWGSNATGYHLTNVLLHLLNSFLLFILSGKLFSRFSPKLGFDWRPWFAALLFLVYGCHTESVFWILGRGGSLSALFVLVSVIFYLQSAVRKGWIILSYLAFIAGMFAYEATLAAPVIITLVWICGRVSKTLRESGWQVWGYWLLTVAYLGYRWTVNSNLLNSYEVGAFADFNFVTVLYNLNTLIARTLVPPSGQPVVLLAVYIILLSLFVLVVMRAKRQGRPVVLAILSFLCILASVLPFITLGADTHDSESGRFVYVSSLFAVIFLSEICTMAFEKPNGPGYAFAGLLMVHSWYFISTGDDYRYAGIVARESLACITANKGMTHFVDVPQQYRGALIFRSGLPEALAWYNGQEGEAIIHSAKEIKQKIRFICDPAVRTLPGATFEVVEDGNPVEVFIPLRESDRIYQWTENGIICINP